MPGKIPACWEKITTPSQRSGYKDVDQYLLGAIFFLIQRQQTFNALAKGDAI